MKHGANTEAESKFDKTPVDISDDNGRPDLKDMLMVRNLCTERPIYWIISKLKRKNTHIIFEKPGIFATTKNIIIALHIF